MVEPNDKESSSSSSSSSTPSSSVTQSAARGTIATILLRVVSFVCTQWTLRRLDPTVLGQTSIQLELVLTTILFVSREGFRLALTRNISPENWNVAWLSIPVVTVVAAAVLAWHHYTTTTTNDDFWYGGVLYCLASCIEGWGEPAVLYALRQMNVALKASAEGAATVVKALSTVALLQVFAASHPITAFGAAQVLYACTYTGILYARTLGQLPRPTGVWHAATCRLTVVFTVQGLFKHFLTEGDRFLLTTLSDGYQQGVYAMGSAYGGLAARLLLQPLEENARLLWSRLAMTTNDSASGKSEKLLLEDSYTVLVKAVLYLGLLFSCIAVHFTGILLHVLAGRKWGSNDEAIAVLSAFCVYTAFLAANGMTEAFVYATASTAADMGRMGVVHTAVGLVFAVTAAWAVKSYGTLGLVAANCLAMALRTAYSLSFAVLYFQKIADLEKDKVVSVGTVVRRVLGQISPHGAVCVAFASSWAATRFSLAYFEQHTAHVSAGSLVWWKSAAVHVGVGAACGIGTLSLAYVFEKSFRRTAVSLYKGTKRD